MHAQVDQSIFLTFSRLNQKKRKQGKAVTGRQLAQMDLMHFLLDMLNALFKNEIIAQKDELCMNGILWRLFLRNYVYTFFYLAPICIPGIWKQGDFLPYRGISVTQDCNASHYAKLYILCVCTQKHVYFYTMHFSVMEPSKALGLLQLLQNRSAVLEVIFFFDRLQSYSYSALNSRTTCIIAHQHKTCAIERCSIPCYNITLVSSAFNNPSHCTYIRAKWFPC